MGRHDNFLRRKILPVVGISYRLWDHCPAEGNVMIEASTTIIANYTDSLPTYQAFASRLESLLRDLVEAAEIKIHFAESRAKSPESLAEKLNRPGKSYEEPLSEVPDLVGIRLILYYQDDVPTVGDLIREQFSLIEEEEAHQPEKYSPDQFGYLSMHYIVGLNTSRARLPEWKAFTGIRAEIQVRTLLQHSWAAVSRALQYNREGDVPITLRRKLFRLAGLFELADEEFVDIRRAHDAIVAESIEAVRTEKKGLLLDAPVLREAIKTSTAMTAVVEMMESIGYDFTSDGDFVGKIVEECERLGISTLEDLESVISTDHSAFLKRLFSDTWRVSRSFALYLVLIATHPDRFDEDYLIDLGWGVMTASRVVRAATQDEKT